jgi:recombination protein RecA
MDNKDGDKMGMRRAKEFSEELRKTCRILTQKNLLMVCSNQVRVNIDAGPYGQKYTTPGGEAIGFYSSLRLRFSRPDKIKAKEKIAGKEVTRVIGVESDVEVYKSSIWKPYRTAKVTILFDYGIDDIRQNLQFIKDHTKNTVYTLGENKLDGSMEKSIRIIEESKSEGLLREQVIDLWEDIEKKFESERKPKQR